MEDSTQLSVLADGAEWIWDQVAQQFPGATEVLDIYHACEHLDTAAKALFGSGTEAATAWLDQSRQQLLRSGWVGLCEPIGQTLVASATVETQAAIDELTTYFSKQLSRRNYR